MQTAGLETMYYSIEGAELMYVLASDVGKFDATKVRTVPSLYTQGKNFVVLVSLSLSLCMCMCLCELALSM